MNSTPIRPQIGAAQPVQEVAQADPPPLGEDAVAVHKLLQFLRREGLVAHHGQVRGMFQPRAGPAQGVELRQQVAAQPEGVQRLVHPRL